MTGHQRPKFDHSGSTFDSFVEEERILKEVEMTAAERTAARRSELAGKSTILLHEIEERQRTVCTEHAAEHVAARSGAKSGFALTTKGQIPINGLRHPVTIETTGWYIWCGENFSNASDFFAPLHTRHLYEDYPQIAHLLGLPPGFRFLLGHNSLDVWFDHSLLTL